MPGRLRLAVRHGDHNTAVGGRTPSALVTTPESLDVLLSSGDGPVRDMLRAIRVVIVDEVHQLYGTRRGFHLKVLLERLKHLAGRPLQRLLLSATVADPAAVADYFQGTDGPFQVVQCGVGRALRLSLDRLPADSVEDFLSGAALLRLFGPIAEAHGKLLVFANTRNECD
jgi:ATP-dependent helicase Lhr and Lhr-like helicase